MTRDSRAQAAFAAAMALAGTRDWPRMAEGLQTALTAAPDDVEILYNLTVVLLRIPDYAAAQAAGARAIRIDPHFPNLQLSYGNALTGLRRHVEAVDAYLRALGADPQSLAAHHNLGNCFEQLKLFEEAYEAGEMCLILGADRSSVLSCMVWRAANACNWALQDVAQARLDAYLASGGQNNCGPFQGFVAGTTRARQLESARNYWKKHCGDVKPL